MHSYGKEAVLGRPTTGRIGLIMCIIILADFILADCAPISQNKLYHAFLMLMGYSEIAQCNKKQHTREERVHRARHNLSYLFSSFFFSPPSYKR